jgi:hypothetical protein
VRAIHFDDASTFPEGWERFDGEGCGWWRCRRALFTLLTAALCAGEAGWWVAVGDV